jgi:hypothetical protein
MESETGRHFNDMVEEFIQSECQDADSEAQLLALLHRWRNNSAAFQRLAEQSYLAAEATATSQDLAAIGDAGLAAMDYLRNRRPASDDWEQKQSIILKQAQRPKAQLVLIPTSGVEKLLEAAASGKGCRIQ